METTQQEPPHVNRKKERKGSGFLASFLNKLGLGPTPGAGSAIGVGGASAGAGSGVGGAGLAGGILATKAGIVALILAGTTIAAGIGVVGRSALSSSRGGGGGIWSVLPTKPVGSGSSGEAAAPANGASSSLDYMAQAAKGDPLLQDGPPAQSAEAVASSDGSASNDVGVPDHTNAPANVGGGSSSGPRLQKAPSLSGQTSGGSSGSMLAMAPASNARNAASGSRVGGLSPMGRNASMSAAGGGRRALVGARGQKTSDMLKFANRDGQSQKGAKNPSMARAGSTFDGGASGLQSSAAGVPTASPGGGVDEGARSRFSPNRVLDQRNVPQPPKVEGEKDVTAYKKFMYAAMAALGVAMLLGFLAGKKKDEAKAAMAGGPASQLLAAGLYQAAATLHWLAAAAAGVALAMGVILMTAYDQMMQGMIFTAIGGFLAFKNVSDALDASKGAKDAKANEKEAMDMAKARQGEIDKLLRSGKVEPGSTQELALKKEYLDLGKATGNSAWPPQAPASATGTPVTGTPAAGTPAAGTPAAGTPAAGTPAAGTPAAGTPAAGTPAAGTPAAGTPAAGTPAAGTPAAGTPAAGTPATGTPATGTPVTGTPATGAVPAEQVSISNGTAGGFQSTVPSPPMADVDPALVEDWYWYKPWTWFA